MFRHLIVSLLALTGSIASTHAQEQDGLLPVEQAFRLSHDPATRDRVALRWEIAPDYYLYRERIKATTKTPGVTLGALDLPAGKPKHDEFFGDVEIYHDQVSGSLPFTVSDPSLREIEVTVSVQGCHEVDPLICYPPHPTRLVLALPVATAAMDSVLGAPPGGSGLFGSTRSTLDDSEALPPEQAFVFEAIAVGPGEILARWSMPQGYYLYRDRSKVDVADERGVAIGKLAWPVGVDHVDEHFGTVVVYFGQVELPLNLARENGAAQTILLRAEFQGCKENGICYPVMERYLEVDLPAATAQELASAAAAFVPADPPIRGDASADNALRSTPPTPTAIGILTALLFALLGGVVLNLMPCVLPVLSLKVIGLAQSGESLAKARTHALWYTLGVLVSFAAVGLVVIALRTAGLALGWGFQLQQPGFVAVLIYVLLAVGLSLSGVFTIGAGLAGVGQNLAGRSGPAGDFFTGVLAVVVASPCTAPFMGPALAFAFASSPVVALAIFLALGLGLALPFLLVGFVPALATRLPRPGAWMETFKQLIAFPMYATAVWLVWVLGKQRGVDAIGLVLAGAVVLALALWWLERSRWNRSTSGRVFAIVLLVAALVPIWAIARLQTPVADGAAVSSDGSIAYSPENLAELRRAGRAVFVNMTADWCVTCKANERNVLSSEGFGELLIQNDAVYMKGDWTNVDPQITAFLQEHGAVGVPLYVVFRGNGDPGQVLPTLLTLGIVEAALARGAR